MSYADQLYLSQLEFKKQMDGFRASVRQGFEAINECEQRQAEEREAQAEGEEARTPEGRARAAWDSNVFSAKLEDDDMLNSGPTRRERRRWDEGIMRIGHYEEDED